MFQNAPEISIERSNSENQRSSSKIIKDPLFSSIIQTKWSAILKPQTGSRSPIKTNNLQTWNQINFETFETHDFSSQIHASNLFEKINKNPEVKLKIEQYKNKREKLFQDLEERLSKLKNLISQKKSFNCKIKLETFCSNEKTQNYSQSKKNKKINYCFCKIDENKHKQELCFVQIIQKERKAKQNYQPNQIDSFSEKNKKDLNKNKILTEIIKNKEKLLKINQNLQNLDLNEQSLKLEQKEKTNKYLSQISKLEVAEFLIKKQSEDILLNDKIEIENLSKEFKTIFHHQKKFPIQKTKSFIQTLKKLVEKQKNMKLCFKKMRLDLKKQENFFHNIVDFFNLESKIKNILEKYDVENFSLILKIQRLNRIFLKEFSEISIRDKGSIKKNKIKSCKTFY